MTESQEPTGVDNDACVDASPLTFGRAMPVTAIVATNDFTGRSGRAVAQQSGAAWYRFRGIGGTVKVSTCHGDPNFRYEVFDTQINTTSCGTLVA